MGVGTSNSLTATYGFVGVIVRAPGGSTAPTVVVGLQALLAGPLYLSGESAMPGDTIVYMLSANAFVSSVSLDASGEMTFVDTGGASVSVSTGMSSMASSATAPSSGAALEKLVLDVSATGVLSIDGTGSTFFSSNPIVYLLPTNLAGGYTGVLTLNGQLHGLSYQTEFDYPFVQTADTSGDVLTSFGGEAFYSIASMTTGGSTNVVDYVKVGSGTIVLTSSHESDVPANGATGAEVTTEIVVAGGEGLGVVYLGLDAEGPGTTYELISASSLGGNFAPGYSAPASTNTGTGTTFFTGTGTGTGTAAASSSSTDILIAVVIIVAFVLIGGYFLLRGKKKVAAAAPAKAAKAAASQSK